MKKVILPALCALFVITACRQATSTFPQFTVKYNSLQQYEGDTLYLWRTHLDAMWRFADEGYGVIDSAVITNGTAVFTGQEDTLHFYLIEGAGNNRVAFYPERGDLTITQLPPEQPGMDDRITFESTNPQSKNVAFYDLRDKKKYPVEETRKMLFENIGNAIGSQLLNGYAIIYPDETQWLYDNSNEQLRDSAYSLVEIKEMLDNTRSLNVGDKFINFRQVESFSNDTIEFADIAGHGYPVCLLFESNPGEKNLIRNEMDRIKKKYPDIRFILPVFYFANPEYNDFNHELKSHYNAVLVDDNRGRGEFKNSVRYLYRLRSGVNYSCIFDGEGKLLSKKNLSYEGINTFHNKLNAVLSAWEKPTLSYSSNSNDYLSVEEYADFKNYILSHPQGISLLLDYTLHYDNAFGLMAYLIDDIVRTKYKDAPALQGYINSGKVNPKTTPALVREYINKVRTIAGDDFTR